MQGPPCLFLSRSLCVGLLQSTPVWPTEFHGFPGCWGVRPPTHVLSACSPLERLSYPQAGKSHDCLTSWPTYMLTHRFIVRLNEGAASSLYPNTVLSCCFAPAPLQQQWGNGITAEIIWYILTSLHKHQQTFWIINIKTTSFPVAV